MRTSPTGQRPRKLKLAARRSASTTDTNGFFQHPEVNVVYSPECADIPADPALVCDTFVTIGLECAPALPGLDGTSIDLDFDVNEFQFNGRVLGGWYNSLPTNGQGTPDANGKVLIAQLSAKQNKDISGTLTVFAKLAGSDDVVEYALQAFDCFGESAGGGGGGGPTSEPQGEGAPLGGGGCPQGTIWFVDDDGGEFNGCTTWLDACPDLQTALDPAMGCDQIWVAEGIYRPSDCTAPCEEADRSESFELLAGVALYGGFEGNEATFEDRAGLFDTTILTGDLNGNDGPDPFEDNVENSYHVVVANSGADITAVLDGFTITGGNANGTNGPPPGGNDTGSAVHIAEGATPNPDIA